MKIFYSIIIILGLTSFNSWGQCYKSFADDNSLFDIPPGYGNSVTKNIILSGCTGSAFTFSNVPSWLSITSSPDGSSITATFIDSYPLQNLFAEVTCSIPSMNISFNVTVFVHGVYPSACSMEFTAYFPSPYYPSKVFDSSGTQTSGETPVYPTFIPSSCVPASNLIASLLPNWLSVGYSVGPGGYSYTFYALPNNSIESRYATIIMSNSLGGLETPVCIKQQGNGCIWYSDNDGDGLGDPFGQGVLAACSPPPFEGAVLNNIDNCTYVYGTNNNGCYSSNENYIMTIKPKIAVNNLQQINNTSNVLIEMTYYDGLGRPIQKIAHKQSATGKDIVTPIDYDSFGRQEKEYLPFIPTTLSSLDIKSNEVLSFYATNNTALTGNSDFETTNNPYSKKEFEASPLNRVTKQAAPGDPWSMGSGHEIKYDYQTNIPKEVRKFKVIFASGTTEVHHIEPIGFYAPNALHKTVTKTENWTPSDLLNNTTQEFKDNEGKIVLKRTFSHDVVPNSFPVEYADSVYNTYYVYDIYGNLSYVIPPLASDAIDAFYVTTAVANRNYPWTKIANVTGELAEEYNKLFSEYKNELIANADLYAKYGGQGGFTLSTSSNNEPVLSITMNTLEPMELRVGEIISLKELGDFKDSEMGRIQGEGYEYIFYIKGNVLMLDGRGKVNNINIIFNGNTKLVYNTNYPWSSIVDIDSKEAEKYNEFFNQFDNATILTRNIENSYGAMGGLTITIDENDEVTANFAMASITPLKLKNGIVITLKTERRIADTDLGVIEAEGLKYRLSIKENSLYIEGDGSFTSMSLARGNNPSGGSTIILPIPLDIIEGLCYKYHYDYRNRLIEKKIPGKGWEYIVYDKLDRVALTQDANLRSQKKWLYTKYDIFNRVVYTGDFKFYSANTDSNLRMELQGLIASNATPNEGKSSVFENGGIVINYSEGNFPNRTNIDFRVFTVNYYDDYSFQPYGAPISIPPSITFNGSTTVNMATNVKSLPTGSLVRILETNNWIVNLTAYDTRFRPFWSKSENSYLQTTDESTSLLDFTGKILQTVSNHSKSGVISNLGVIDRFTYDNADRLTKQTQTVGSNSEELIALNQYDELGNLIQKKVGGLANTPTGLQTIDYSYNIRGWLKTINDPTNILTGDLFAFKINYDLPELGATPLYNGNISETRWRTKNDNNQRNYKYSYDNLNRLTNAEYVTPIPIPLYNNLASNENYSEGNIQYDKNGNITHLERSGLKGGFTPSIGVIDNLNYLYNPRSNQLKHLVDTSTEPAGYQDTTPSTQQPDGGRFDPNYAYDINGNMTKDKNKGIYSNSITYNHLNLPTKINFTTNPSTNTKYIEYVYDAIGTKLKKVVKNENSTNLTTTLYDNGYVYLDGVLQYLSQPEGYVAHNNGLFSYVYQFKDHLGNIRLSYSDSNNNRVITTSEIIEECNYYPFGLKHSGYNINITSTNSGQKYKFQGQERQDELSLNWDSFKWRNYDYAIGRFMNIDPLSEKYSHQSHYNFSENRVVDARELEGLEAIRLTGAGGFSMLMTQPASSAQQKSASIGFAMRHPSAANSIGEIERGGTNISSISGRIARHMTDRNNMTSGIGSKNNAFRHALWSATMSNQFGDGIATRAGNAHEGGKVFGSLTIDFNAPLVQNADYADSVVDILNNEIGRGIAEGLGENANQIDIATKVLNVQRDQGLWEVITDKDGNITISRQKITEKQHTNALRILNTLDNNGFNQSDRDDLQNN